jgi:hypothetical protein
LLGAPARIERDLRDEELSRQIFAVDVVGQPGFVLDDEAVQLRPAPEHRAQTRLDLPHLHWTSRIHDVTISPTGYEGHDVCPPACAFGGLELRSP